MANALQLCVEFQQNTRRAYALAHTGGSAAIELCCGILDGSIADKASAVGGGGEAAQQASGAIGGHAAKRCRADGGPNVEGQATRESADDAQGVDVHHIQNRSKRPRAL